MSQGNTLQLIYLFKGEFLSSESIDVYFRHNYSTFNYLRGTSGFNPDSTTY